jgi:Amt family ammonium transporter
MGGTWGALATGLFVGIGFGALADGVSRGEQVIYQLIAVGAAWGWSFVMTSVILLAIKYTIGLRVTPADETLGLDASEHGESSYIR